MNELNENSFYPQKPIFEEKKESGNWIKTLLSMALFIGTFLLIFEEQLSFVLMLVLVLFVHELGHFLLMKLFKYENVKMLFVPLMGAFVQGKKKQYSQFESLLVVGAGPFPGIILGVLFLFLFQINLDANYFLISILFFALNLINLLPLDPLDGGQLFKLLLRKNSDLFLLIFSFTSSMILILLGLYLENWYLTIFGFFMRSDKPYQVLGASIAGPTSFFLTSNFLVWIGGGGYHHPKTFAGLMNTYMDGIPFYQNSVISTVVFSCILFGTYYLLAKNRSEIKQFA
jgi:Zn-dependent protease